MIDVHFIADEDAGALLEAVGILCGVVGHLTSLGAPGIHVGMAVEIVLQAGGYIFALRHDAHVGTDVFHNLGQQYRIVGAAQDERVDERILLHELVDVNISYNPISDISPLLNAPMMQRVWLEHTNVSAGGVNQLRETYPEAKIVNVGKGSVDQGWRWGNARYEQMMKMWYGNFYGDEFRKYDDLMYLDWKGQYHCILPYDAQTGDGILIDTEGCSYPKYYQLVPNAKLLIEHYEAQHEQTAGQTENESPEISGISM